MPTCGSPNTKGLVITVQANIISTYAVSKYTANTASLDNSCQQYFQLPEPEENQDYHSHDGSMWQGNDADGVQATTETSLGLGFGDKVLSPGRVKPLPLALQHRASSNTFGPKADTKRTHPSKGVPTQSRVPTPRAHFVTQPIPHSTKQQPHSAFIAPDTPRVPSTNTAVGNNQHQHQHQQQAAKPVIQAAPTAPQPQLTAPQPVPQSVPQPQPSTMAAPATAAPQPMPQGLAPQPKPTPPQPAPQAASDTQPSTETLQPMPQSAPQPAELTAPQQAPQPVPQRHAAPQPAPITVQEQQPVQQPQADPAPQLVQQPQPNPQHVAQQPVAQAQPTLPSEQQQASQGTHATPEDQTLNQPTHPLFPATGGKNPVITGGLPAPTAPASPGPDSTSKPAAAQPIQGQPLENLLPTVGHPQLMQPAPTSSPKPDQQPSDVVTRVAPEQNATADHLSLTQEPHAADAFKPQASAAQPEALSQHHTEPDISVAAPQPVNSQESKPVSAEEPKTIQAHGIQPVTAQHPTGQPADAQQIPTGPVQQVDLNSTTHPSEETKQAPVAQLEGPSDQPNPTEETKGVNTSSLAQNISQALPSAPGHASDQQAHLPADTNATPEHTLHSQAASNPATQPTAQPLPTDFERHQDPQAPELLHKPLGSPEDQYQPTQAKPGGVLKPSQLWMLEEHATDLFDVLKYSVAPAVKTRASVAHNTHHTTDQPATGTTAQPHQQASTPEDDLRRFTTQPPHGRLLLEQSAAQRRPATDPKPKPTPQPRLATQSGHKSSATRPATGRRVPAASGSPAKLERKMAPTTKPMMPWLHMSSSTRQGSTLVRKQQYDNLNQESTQHDDHFEEPERHEPLHDDPAQTGGREEGPTWLHRVREGPSERENDAHKGSSLYGRMHEEDENANSQEGPARYDHRREEFSDTREDWRKESMQDRLREESTEHESHYRDSRQYEDQPQHEEAPEEARGHDDDEGSMDRYISRQQYMASSYFGGRATIIQGVITSVAGLGDDASYEGGTIEYVAAFEGASLSVAEYEALPQQTPQITPGIYKIELTEG